MIRRAMFLPFLLSGLLLTGHLIAQDSLRQDFLTPPDSAKAWCYWWWLNGNASKEGITRDFEEMKKQGISGALLFDAGEAGADVQRGPQFMSPQWRELYKHAVREADRCGIALGVNLCSGWNAGGPWVTPEHAAKKLVSTQTLVQGPGRVSVALAKPPATQDFYRDIVVLASPVPEAIAACKLVASSQYQNYSPALAEDGNGETRWISNGDKPGMGPTPEKPEFLQFDFDQPWSAAGVYLKPYSDCGPHEIEVQCAGDDGSFRPLTHATLKPQEEKIVTFDETRAKHFRILILSAHPFRGEADWNVQVAEIALLSKDEVAKKKPVSRLGWDRSHAVDVTKFMDDNGQLQWDVPPGSWKVLRIGYTLHGNMTKCVGSGPAGLEIDTMSAAAMDAHFAETGAKLIADAGPLVGKTLQYFHIDSWELGQPTWTPRMREEFQARRGYDPLPWLPAVLGLTADSAEETNRFLQDYRRTAADLVAKNYYGRLHELTLNGGLLGTHPESGGPFFDHWIDALQCEGINDIPMGEFWKRNTEPDGPITWDPSRNPTVKQAACAAHIYGKPVCQAEAFTAFACDWTATPWNMKDIGDAAFCEGLTRYVLCFWVHQPRLDAKPGFQWAHVGTHFDCNVTWWPMADAWLTYVARCQHMLRQGAFVADFAYLQDEAIPSFISPRASQRPAGFDYDVLNAEVLLTRGAVKDGRLVLPDGMSYRYLVLPQTPDAILSPATLKKINELAAAGVSVVGSKTLAENPHQNSVPSPLRNEKGGGVRGSRTGSESVPALREGTPESVARADGLMPDVELRDPSPGAKLDWIHRRDGKTDIYFVCNQSALDATVHVAFRVIGKQPELWDAVTGNIRDLHNFRVENGRTVVPLKFAPRQSWFVVFRRQAEEGKGAVSASDFPDLQTVMQVTGPWQVSFDPKWFYPDSGTGSTVRFDQLEDWTKRPEDAIRYYSGVATYRTAFQSPATDPQHVVYLDLGSVKDVARVRLNGRDVGGVWTAPWRVEVAGAIKPGANELEIDVSNLWPNRLIGDATLAADKRHTVTNVRTYDTMASGTYGCKICEERKKSGKPAALLPSGLLGPVTLQMVMTPK